MGSTTAKPERKCLVEQNEAYPPQFVLGAIIMTLVLIACVVILWWFYGDLSIRQKILGFTALAVSIIAILLFILPTWHQPCALFEGDPCPSAFEGHPELCDAKKTVVPFSH